MYVFECEYGSRVKERAFIKDILRNFDKNYATLVGAIVNNNPYCLEFSIVVNLQDDPVAFENWLKGKYPDKFKRHNIFISDITRYNVQTFIDEDMVDMILVPEGRGFLFLWPEQELLEEQNPQLKCLKKKESKVFLSHSSKDKKAIVNPLNAFLQAEDIATWLDSAEIDYGDNIYLKVNEGIENADLGVFILTDHFFDSKSGWPIKEFSTFFMEMMDSEKEILLINAGVSPEKMHAMMKPYKYLEWTGLDSLPDIGNAIRRKLSA
tara:strand:- start:147 stop:941 length:795 start_codon:yes stop_codon:yes gene_type:complete